ncbi:hypothetical protein TNCV_4002901 [Trichonephila clavipes]|nr:hypothetical protein TNCV_4002901 [Trichonephila clavipes]
MRETSPAVLMAEATIPATTPIKEEMEWGRFKGCLRQGQGRSAAAPLFRPPACGARAAHLLELALILLMHTKYAEAQTSSPWCGVDVRRGASLDVIFV